MSDQQEAHSSLKEFCNSFVVNQPGHGDINNMLQPPLAASSLVESKPDDVVYTICPPSDNDETGHCHK